MIKVIKLAVVHRLTVFDFLPNTIFIKLNSQAA